jgi:L-alanine-DL-glutamate epimerase-like enolase superfamily enzyme
LRSDLDDMHRIINAQASLLELRLDKPVGGSGITHVDVVVVDMSDDVGTTGLGFTYALGGGGKVILECVRTQLDKAITGRALVHPNVLWETIASRFNRTGWGPNLVALAAIDLATWDLYSKTLGLPLASAVGGAPRPIPVYGSGGFTAAQSALEAAHVAEGYVKRGFQAVKPRAQGNISRDSQILKAVRRAVGDGATMMVDANEKCDLAGAKQLLLLARDHDVAFVEEPLPAHALSAYRALTRCAPVAIATGEHLQTIADFLPYLSEGLIDVVQPDLAMMGGITPILKLCTLAETFNLTLSPHFLPGLFVHVAAASKTVRQLEEFPLIESLFEGWPTCDAQGRLMPGTENGHGLRLRSSQRDGLAP